VQWLGMVNIAWTQQSRGRCRLRMVSNCKQ
jgi:hypothetical protein